jgi:hypothetical protein
MLSSSAACKPVPRKASQVYLNTLAVWAVNVYLEALGFETNLNASASQDTVDGIPVGLR